MSKPQFDRNRPYGTITPFWNGAGLHQDGCYFSPQGEFLFREGERSGDDDAASDTAGAVVAPAEPEAKAKKAAKKTAKTTTAKTPAADPATGSKTGQDGQNQPAADVDLAKWASGEQTAPFFAVKKAFTAKFPDSEATTAAAIKAELADAGVI